MALMRVAQLIETLQQRDPNTVVMIQNDDNASSRSPLTLVQDEKISLNSRVIPSITLLSDPTSSNLWQEKRMDPPVTTEVHIDWSEAK